MDLSRTRLVLRERSVVDIFDLALRFVIVHGSVYAKTAAVIVPPFAIASIMLGRRFGWLGAWGFALFAATFVGAPFTVLASRLVFEDDVRFTRALLDALRNAHRLLVLRLMAFVVGGVGLVIFTIPGLWFLAIISFVVEVTVLERASIVGAVTRSARIVRRESGQAIVAALLLGLLFVVIVLAADIGGSTIITALLQARAPAPIWDDGWSTLGLVGFWLFVPYATTARFFVYLDIRTRSEGWDIQTRFVALATRPPADVRKAA
jgi:hypothetical protein